MELQRKLLVSTKFISYNARVEHLEEEIMVVAGERPHIFPKLEK